MVVVFFLNDTATTEIFTLSLHDALPILWTTLAPVPAELPVAILTVSVSPVAVAPPAMLTVLPVAIATPLAMLTVAAPVPLPTRTLWAAVEEPRVMLPVPAVAPIRMVPAVAGVKVIAEPVPP